MKTLLLASAVLAGLLACSAAAPFAAAPDAITPGPTPYHAFCRTMWLFAVPCGEINTTIIKQLQAFSPLAGCSLCQYRVVSVTPRTIKANHTSVDGLQTENISFDLIPTVMTGGCRVTAQSASLGFTSLFDNGLNYCNLYNVLSASGLVSSPGFMEMTNEWACLSYGLATCDDK